MKQLLLQTNTRTGSSCSKQGLGGRSVPGPRASQVATNYDDDDDDYDDGVGDDDGGRIVCPRAKSFMSHGQSAPKTGNQHLQLCFLRLLLLFQMGFLPVFHENIRRQQSLADQMV